MRPPAFDPWYTVACAIYAGNSAGLGKSLDTANKKALDSRLIHVVVFVF